MAISKRVWVVLIAIFLFSQQFASAEELPTVVRGSFPKDFVFGTATAAHQYEGAAKEGGKGPSIWNTFTHQSWKIKGNTTGDVGGSLVVEGFKYGCLPLFYLMATCLSKIHKGIIGITTDCSWYTLLNSNSTSDQQTAEEVLEGFLKWYLDPIFFGDYPASMRETLGSNLPTFTPKQAALIKDSQDFVGINH